MNNVFNIDFSDIADMQIIMKTFVVFCLAVNFAAPGKRRVFDKQTSSTFLLLTPTHFLCGAVKWD